MGAIRAANSATKVLVYQEAQTEGPGSCQYDTHPSWGISYCYADANHPEWFLLTNSGQRAQYTDNGYYMMDIGSVSYQQAFAANVIATARRDGFDGVELDDVNLSPAHGTDGTLAKYTDAQYAAATESFVAAVSRDVSAAGLVISANVGNSNPWDSTALAESQQIAANLSVYNHEFWLRWQEGTPLMTGAEWLASITHGGGHPVDGRGLHGAHLRQPRRRPGDALREGQLPARMERPVGQRPDLPARPGCRRFVLP